jgi:hypothetical protein
VAQFFEKFHRRHQKQQIMKTTTTKYETGF